MNNTYKYDIQYIIMSQTCHKRVTYVSHSYHKRVTYFNQTFLLKLTICDIVTSLLHVCYTFVTA